LNRLPAQSDRVLSGMRPTGRLHLGHYNGVLKNWVTLQHEYPCFFFVADWHALTTHYDDTGSIADHALDMVVDWLAAGVDPGSATLFVQSRVPEHAELHLLLSMITPIGWLERVPTYKDMQEQLREKDLATYGFLGYPLLQAADILIYRAGRVPVGEDQVAHVELTREVARRFNFLYGREPGFEEKAEAAIKKMGKKTQRLYQQQCRRYQEQKERLYGYLEGSGVTILPEPEALLTAASKMPGLDGRKMSKSYGNTISLRDDPGQVEQKIRTMPTDPARVRRSDAGNPEKCPVWEFHKIYSDSAVHDWVREGCVSAGIGCVECKQPVIDAVIKELAGFAERAAPYEQDPELVKQIVADGCDAARDEARETLTEVRQAIGLSYR